jgi:signal transduction histidine kinase
MFRSVRWRLLFNSLAVSLAAILAVGVVTLVLVNGYFERQERLYLEERAAQLALPLEDALRWGNDPQTLQTIVQLALFTSQVRVRLLDPDRELLADSGSLSELPIVEPFTDQVAPSAGFHAYVDMDGRIVFFGPGAELSVTNPNFPPTGEFVAGGGGGPAPVVRSFRPPINVVSDTTIEKPLYVQNQLVGYAEFSEGPALGQVVVGSIRRALMGGSVVALALAVVVGLLSAQQVTQPLQALGTAVDRMAVGDLSARAAPSHLDEINRLADQFNGMAGQLSQTINALEADRAALRRLIADASHELRTPLTALKTFNELMGQEQTAEPATTFVRESNRQLEQLDRLTTGLLDLSRFEARLSGTNFAIEDVRPAVTAAVQRLRPLAAAKGQALQLSLTETTLALPHDAAAIERAVSNLVNNAIKYTPVGGRIEVTLTGRDNLACIAVSDNGPGIPAGEQPFIFDRFYRGRGQKGEGSGLGLAICREIAAIHQGSIAFSSQEGQGSTFTICLPLTAVKE